MPMPTGPKIVVINRIPLIIHWYKMVHFVLKNVILIISILHLSFLFIIVLFDEFI